MTRRLLVDPERKFRGYISPERYRTDVEARKFVDDFAKREGLTLTDIVWVKAERSTIRARVLRCNAQGRAYRKWRRGRGFEFAANTRVFLRPS